MSLQKQHSTSGGGDAVDAGAGVVVGAAGAQAADAARGGVEGAVGLEKGPVRLPPLLWVAEEVVMAWVGANAPHLAAGGCPEVVRWLLASTPPSAFSWP